MRPQIDKKAFGGEKYSLARFRGHVANLFSTAIESEVFISLALGSCNRKARR
jgi:hypothetical protein